MDNILIGAISGNYTVDNLKTWIETSNYPNIKRVLFYYNPASEELAEYCKANNVELVYPNFNLYGQEVNEFIANSGLLTPANSPYLIHHIRFLHWWYYLKDLPESNVMLTDVNDLKFNKNPFDYLSSTSHPGIIASSEEITHDEEKWNLQNYYTTFGIATDFIKDKEVYNAGSISGNSKVISDLCRDIYLLSINKPRNADQAAYNYLIHTSYKEKTLFTGINDKWGVHLHVVVNYNRKFDLNTLTEYSFVHQYDRLK